MDAELAMETKFGKMKNPLPHLLKTDAKFKEWYFKALKDGLYIHAVTKTPDQWSHLNDKELEIRGRYLPFCSLNEIERILSPKTVADLLLQLRANSILSNMRLLRTFEKRACFVEESKWTLTAQFDDSIFSLFRNSIDEKYSQKIDAIAFGTVFSNDPNGYCVKTDFGPLIVLSEALTKFFYFMNLSLYPYWFKEKTKVSPLTQQQSLVIALRTMLLTESFDFELDPRGTIPKEIDDHLGKTVRTEMLFVVAHEYAHFLLGHLDGENISEREISFVLPSKSSLSRVYVAVYNQSQAQESEADRMAIEILSCNDRKKKRNTLLFAATILSFFKIYESLLRSINNTLSNQTSHPPARQRLNAVIEMGKKVWNRDEMETCQRLGKIIGFFEERVKDWYEKEPLEFKKYGSVYLDDWRDKPKIDRIDY